MSDKYHYVNCASQRFQVLTPFYQLWCRGRGVSRCERRSTRGETPPKMELRRHSAHPRPPFSSTPPPRRRTVYTSPVAVPSPHVLDFRTGNPGSNPPHLPRRHLLGVRGARAGPRCRDPGQADGRRPHDDGGATQHPAQFRSSRSPGKRHCCGLVVLDPRNRGPDLPLAFRVCDYGKPETLPLLVLAFA